jgi:hypothetical protein
MVTNIFLEREHFGEAGWKIVTSGGNTAICAASSRQNQSTDKENPPIKLPPAFCKVIESPGNSQCAVCHIISLAFQS